MRRVRSQASLSRVTRAMWRVVLLAVTWATPAHAQPGGIAGWLPQQSTPGTSDEIDDVVVLPNGEVVVGGGFGAAGDVVTTNLAHFRFCNPTRDLDMSAHGVPDQGDLDALISVIAGGRCP